MLPFTGVGSRNTPIDILSLMQNISYELTGKGYILRSGGALGADSAFERGAQHKEVYYANQATPEAMELAGRFHPAWSCCSEYARKLHGRNSFQVLGINLDFPSKFLICWTPDGCISHETRTRKTGGTGTAISIACWCDVPVFNLQREDHLQRLIAYVNKATLMKVGVNQSFN